MNTTIRKGKKNVDAGIGAAVNSLALLKPNADWAKLPLFDRTDWKRVRFGDVVQNCNETCDPAEAGLERFVAMEHLEPGSLHVRSWGNVADGTTFTRRCRPGQVLFGKRRAYQRKVAVAEFEAVVSGDIYVLAPNDNQRLLPELLPFLCLSERFFQHAVGTSAGSLSPRTNWTSLASFEFDLPPLEQQRRVAEILWAVDQSITDQQILHVNLNQYINAYKSVFFGIQTDTQHKIVRVADIGTKDRQSVQVGPFGGSVSSRHFKQTGVPVIKINNLTDDGLNLSELVYVSEEHANSLAKYRIRRGDILTAAQATTGRSALADERIEGALISQHLIRVAVDENKCIPAYLLEVFASDWTKRQIDMVKSKTTRDGLNTDDVANFMIPIPSVERQRSFLSTVSGVRNAANKVETWCNSTSSAMIALINKLVTP